MPALISPMPSAMSFSPSGASLLGTGSLSGASGGVRLVDASGRELSFRGATVHVRAAGGLAVVVVTQRFVNAHAEPLSVRYTLPLPHDAAVSGYSFRLGERVVRGVVDGRQQARERFTQAVASGRTAGLLDQERSTVFSQELGNLPPGQELEAVIELDQRLVWLDEGSWEWRFPTVVAPRYLGSAGRVADAGALAVDVSEAPLPPRVGLELHVLDELTGKVSSTTHAVTTTDGEGVAVRLAGDARLDRDIAVRWPVGRPEVGVGLRVARGEHTGGGAHGLLTIVPPPSASRPQAVPRDLILLLDASGSMHGGPMQQSKELMRTLVRSLGAGDRLEMVSFGNRPNRWQRAAVAVSEPVRAEALRWIDQLQAEGGTEMRAGILEATRTLREGAQRQVVLITDGLIGFESEIVRTLHESLPVGCRLHTVGVGSAVNRSLTGPAARAGAGVEVILDLDGDVAEATRRLLARTVAPLVTELVIEGDAVLEHAPARLPDLFGGAPLLVSLRVRESGGSIRVRGRTADGPWSAEVAAPPVAAGEGLPSLRSLFGRERVEDLEVLWATGREQGAIDRQIEQTGLDYQIATRLTSWVAVSDEPTVRPDTPSRHETVPQELPHGMSAVGLGLRAPVSSDEDAATGMFRASMPVPQTRMALPSFAPVAARPPMPMGARMSVGAPMPASGMPSSARSPVPPGSATPTGMRVSHSLPAPTSAPESSSSRAPSPLSSFSSRPSVQEEPLSPIVDSLMPAKRAPRTSAWRLVLALLFLVVLLALAYGLVHLLWH